MNRILKKFWPIVVIFTLLTIYSFPYLFQGKVPFPTSYIANNIAPWNKYLSGGPVKNGIPDVPGEIYPTKSLVIDFWHKGIIPLWNPYIFSGAPLLANFQSAAFFPLNALFFFLPKIDAWSILVLFQPMLAAIFMFLFCRELKIGKISSLFSAIAFMFCGYLTVWGSYTTIGYSILFLPLVLFLVERLYNKRNIVTLVFIPIVLAFSFFSGHIQTWLYVFLSTFFYALGKLFSDFNNNKKTFFLIIVGLSITIPLVAIQLLPSLEFYQFAGRSWVKNNPGQVGIPPLYLITLLIPDFFGNPVTRNDWFGTYAEWSGYTGLITLVFAVIGTLRLVMEKKVIPVFLIGLMGLLFAVQNPFQHLLTVLPVPILSNSNPSRAIVLLSFAISVLAGFGFEQFLTNFQKTKKYFFIILGFTTVIIGILFFISIYGNLFFVEGLANSLKVVSLRNLIFPSIIIFFIWMISLLILFKPEFKKQLNTLLVLLIALEMLRFYYKWTPFDDRNLFYPKNDVTHFLKKQNDISRFYGQFGQSAALNEHLYSLEGYEPLNLQAYSQLIRAAVDGKLHNDYQLEVKLQSKESNTKKILDLLGVKYLIYNANDPQSSFVFPVWIYDQNLFPKIFNDGKFLIFDNKDKLDRIKLFSDYEVITDKEKSLRVLFSPRINIKSKLIIDRDPGISSDNLSTGSANLIDYQPNEVKIATKTIKSSILFISDNYYPGWKVYINGKQSSILRSDFSFRSAVVPPGDNLVIFKYESDSFKYGAIISSISLLVIINMYLFRKKIGRLL